MFHVSGFPAVWCGCETLSSTLGEEHWLRVFEKKRMDASVRNPKGGSNRWLEKIVNDVLVACTVQYRTVQYRTLQYRTVQYSTVPYRTLQYRTLPHNWGRSGEGLWVCGVMYRGWGNWRKAQTALVDNELLISVRHNDFIRICLITYNTPFDHIS